MAKRPTPASPDLNESNSDQQSMEKLKKSAGYILGIIVLALAGYFGWNYYQNAGMSADTVAADKYAAIEAANENLQFNGDDDALKQLNADIDALVADHGSTVYAWQALMIKARHAVDNDDYKTAVDALDKAMGIDLKDAGLHAVTQLRYATVLLANGDVDAALKQASVDVPVAFEGSQQELLGDIFLAQDEKEKAVRAYENAWSLLSKRNEERAILRLKLESLGVNPEPIEPQPEIVNQAALASQNEVLSPAELSEEMANMNTDAAAETETNSAE